MSSNASPKPRPFIFSQDDLQVFCAFSFSVPLSQYKDAYPAFPRFLSFDSARGLVSFNTSQYTREFESDIASSSFLMTRDTVQEMSQLFLDAGLLERAQQQFEHRAKYHFTLLGLDTLNRFLHENCDLQNFLKALLGVTSTQTLAAPLALVTSMGAQYFMQAGLIENVRTILSITSNDGGVYQFTPKYFTSAVTFPSGRRVQEDDGVITRVGDVPNETHPHKLQLHDKHLLYSLSPIRLASPTSDSNQSAPSQWSPSTEVPLSPISRD